eukprot:CAMPEP_0175470472 /NCGR_PEP_ID=MMETSP0095-20121207/72864_1 /TAXON_ID=311494 /ORGANISM="Alexandrium monilatum, Strain CCMP3105" /LENGTH=51 /DNA_ID=CAMNT_0016771899 /DNA_START=75 /DNA_END=230 /DNA_ORIENTATION=-
MTAACVTPRESSMLSPQYMAAGPSVSRTWRSAAKAVGASCACAIAFPRAYG